MKHLILSFLFMFACSSAFAADNVESLEKELLALEKELPSIVEKETSLDKRQGYVNRVLALREKIKALKEEEVAATQEPDDSRILVFKGFYKYETDKGYIPHPYAGNSVTVCTYNECGKNIDHQTRTIIDSYPLKIVPGESFTVSAHTDRSYVKHAGMGLGSGSNTLAEFSRATLDISFYYGPNIKVKSEKRKDLNYEYGFKGAFEIDSHASASVDFKYIEHDPETSTSGTHSYVVERFTKRGVFSSAISEKDADPMGKKLDLNYNEKEEAKGDKNHQYGFKFSAGGITAIYDWADSDDEEPVKAEALPEDEKLVAKQDASGQDSGDGSEEDSSVQQSGSGASGSSDEKNQRLPHIEYWLANAEPVENADPDYQLTYDQWGRVHGKTPNGSISLNGKPDSSGLSPADYAWIRGDKSDSLNLCTLKEYVERKLADKETQSCQKPKPQPANQDALPDFAGMSSAKAKTMLKEKGISVKWQAGAIAKDAAQQGLIEKQEPSAGTKMKGLKQVKLWAYRYASSLVLTPDVAGLSYKQAVAKLKNENLTARIGAMVDPTSSQQAGKVVKQHTKAGSKVASGATIVLDVAKGGSASVTMPNVLGLPYGEAEAKLQSMGLNPVYKIGPYASSPAQVKTVVETSYPAGKNIALGTSVTVTAYNTYSEKTAPKTTPRTTPKTTPPPAPKAESKTSSRSFNPNTPMQYSCEVGISSLPVKTSDADRGKVADYERTKPTKGYSCEHLLNGKTVTIVVHFVTSKSEKQQRIQQYCSNKISAQYGDNRAIRIYMNGYPWSAETEEAITAKTGAANAQKMLSFHARQVIPYAVPCP